MCMLNTQERGGRASFVPLRPLHSFFQAPKSKQEVMSGSKNRAGLALVFFLSWFR